MDDWLNAEREAEINRIYLSFNESIQSWLSMIETAQGYGAFQRYTLWVDAYGVPDFGSGCAYLGDPDCGDTTCIEPEHQRWITDASY